MNRPTFIRVSFLSLFDPYFDTRNQDLPREFATLLPIQQPLKAGVLIRSWRSPTWEMIR
jgi:hypothetical protein